jgi:hypothetical protein
MVTVIIAAIPEITEEKTDIKCEIIRVHLTRNRKP